MMQPPITQLSPGPNYTLHLTYATGERKIFDVTPYIRDRWYGRLKDIAYFKTVRPIDGGYGVEWPEGQDIAPYDLYRNSVSVECASQNLWLHYLSHHLNMYIN